jgi:hypothetical protein
VSFEEIKTELAEMPQEQQDQLAAFLVHLRHQRDPRIGREISKRIDDRSPNNWLTLNELKEKWKD